MVDYRNQVPSQNATHHLLQTSLMQNTLKQSTL